MFTSDLRHQGGRGHVRYALQVGLRSYEASTAAAAAEGGEGGGLEEPLLPREERPSEDGEGAAPGLWASTALAATVPLGLGGRAAWCAVSIV